MVDVRKGNFQLDSSFHKRSVLAPKTKKQMDNPKARKARGKGEPKDVYEMGDNIQPETFNYRAGEGKSVSKETTLPMSEQSPNVTVTPIYPGNIGKKKREKKDTYKLK